MTRPRPPLEAKVLRRSTSDVAGEPRRRVRGDRFERARLLKQVRRTRHHHEPCSHRSRLGARWLSPGPRGRYPPRSGAWARTPRSAVPARSGRPPVDTTAATSSVRGRPQRRRRRRCWHRKSRSAGRHTPGRLPEPGGHATRRRASRSMSNTLACGRRSSPRREGRTAAWPSPPAEGPRRRSGSAG